MALSKDNFKWKIGGFGGLNSQLEDVLRIGGHLCSVESRILDLSGLKI